jgi:hypothetical protein
LGQEKISSGFSRSNDFALGFVLGQTTTYIEQVIAGAKLAAQIGCAKEHIQEVIDAAERDACGTIVEDRKHGRAAVWIFRSPFVRALIEEFIGNATPPTAAGVWAMGKLFGYSDSAVGEYLQHHHLIRSASDSESNQHPCSDSSDSRTEPGHCAC